MVKIFVPNKILCVSLLWIALLFSGGCATSLRDASWVAVSSPRFEILSTMNEEKTKDLARELERFHALIYFLTSAERKESPIPTKIYAFRKPSQLRKFANRRWAGIFVPRLRHNTILLTDYSRKMSALEVILHEYVHFVVRNGRRTIYPLWYDEGFAELFSSVKAVEEKMIIGGVPKGRIPAFRYGRWIPMSRIVEATEYSRFSESELGMFYAESWALVHYLTFGRSGDSTMRRDLQGYLLRRANGLSVEVAFENAFGISMKEVDKAVRSMLQKGGWPLFGVPVAKLEYDRAEPIARVPKLDTISVSLGEVLLGFGRGKDAEEYFAAALEFNPSNARAFSGLGDAFKFQGRWEEAEPLFAQAVGLDPNDLLNLLDQGEFLQDLAEAEESSGDRVELILKARELFVRCLEIDPNHPESLVQLGRTYLAIGDDPEAGIEVLERAFEILPSSPQLSYLLTEAYVGAGLEEKAREMMIHSVAVRSEGELDENLRKRIEEIRERLQEKSSKDESSDDEERGES